MRPLSALLGLLLLAACGWAQDLPKYPPPAEVKSAFLKMLDRPKVPADPTTQEITKHAFGWVLEKLSIASEKKANGEVERVPMLILRPEKSDKKLPAVIVLHGTGGSMHGMLGHLGELAKRNIVGVAIDARYHGARGDKGSSAYVQAIAKAWKTSDDKTREHPFYYDTCWDLWRVLDYLGTRPEIDADRIGMVGISMGGIQTWLAAAVDDRVKVIVPSIAVQSFRWSLENDEWGGRARTIAAAHDVAAKDLGEAKVNQKVCRELWNKVIPGMLDQFDCPSMLRLMAGRPLLIVSGTKDANCPYPGAKIAIASAEKAYADAGKSDRLKVSVAEVGHTITPAQWQETWAWFEQWLQPRR
jgi:predicted esterase